jgi:hypothetical protein
MRNERRLPMASSDTSNKSTTLTSDPDLTFRMAGEMSLHIQDLPDWRGALTVADLYRKQGVAEQDVSRVWNVLIRHRRADLDPAPTYEEALRQRR